MKKIGILFDAVDLNLLLSGQDDKFTYEKLLNKEGLSETSFDLILVGDNYMEVNELLNYRKANKDQVIFYYMPGAHLTYSIGSVLEEVGIRLVTDVHTPVKIVHMMIENLLDEGIVERAGNVVTFFGAHGCVGTSMITLAVGEYMAEVSDARIAVVHMDGTLNTDYIDSQAESSLDNLKLNLINRLVTYEEVADILIKRSDNFFIMPGVFKYFYNDEYHPEVIEYFLSIMSREFDMVLVDAGWGAKNLFSIGTLSYSTNNYLIATQSKRIIRRFQQQHKEILKNLGLDDFGVIVNKYISEAAGVMGNGYEIAARLGHPYVGCVAMSRYGMQADYEGKSLRHFEDRKFNRSLEKVGDQILNRQNIRKKAEGRWYDRVLGIMR